MRVVQISKEIDPDAQFKDFKAGYYMPTLAQQLSFVAKTNQYESLKRQLTDAVERVNRDIKDNTSCLHTYIKCHPELVNTLQSEEKMHPFLKRILDNIVSAYQAHCNDNEEQMRSYLFDLKIKMLRTFYIFYIRYALHLKKV